jgi:glycosyltransferase involved in cell wall biosynthesis
MSVERSPEALPVQVLIPALNEALALPRVLQGLQAQGLARILVVDNGSTDGTAAAARAGGAQVVIEPRRGYGQACWAGLQSLAGQTPEARAPWVLFVDADAGDDLIALPCFLAAAAQGADLVLANFLLERGFAGQIVLHAKMYPVFVSDAIARDVNNTIDFLAFSENPPVKALAIRLRGSLLYCERKRPGSGRILRERSAPDSRGALLFLPWGGKAKGKLAG